MNISHPKRQGQFSIEYEKYDVIENVTQGPYFFEAKKKGVEDKEYLWMISK